MAKEFIITEGDIDQALSSMLAERSRSSFVITESDIKLQFELMLLEQDDDGDGQQPDPEEIKKAVMAGDSKISKRLLDNSQKVLDIIGIASLIPFPPAVLVAEAANVLSFIMNTARGKYGWAIFDLLAMIPFAGGGLKGLKVAKQAFTAAKSAKAAEGLLIDLIPEETMKKAIEAPIPSWLKKGLPEDSEAEGFIDAIIEIMGRAGIMGAQQRPFTMYWKRLKKTYEEGGFANAPDEEEPEGEEGEEELESEEGEEELESEEEFESEKEIEGEKKVETDIGDYKWMEPQTDGSVDWLSGFKFRGSLDKSFGPLQAMFIEMFTFYRTLVALAEKGDSLTGDPYFGMDKGEFYKRFVFPKEEQMKVLINGLNLMRDAQDGGSSDDAKKAFESLSNELQEKKKILDTDSGLAKKFNAIKDEYLENMQKEVKKMEKDSDETEALQEGMLHSITIDFAEIRRKQKHLDESFLVMFGGWVKWLLGKMFDGGSIPGTIKGSRSEVESFARAMGSEKRYIETAKRYGLDHPTTYKSKAKLSSATKGFEKETGIKWPFE